MPNGVSRSRKRSGAAVCSVRVAKLQGGTSVDAPFVPAMVDRVPRDETPRAEEPASPLHDAAERGDIEELRRLISAGVDPDEEDWRGMSPLYCAVDGGSASATRVLLDTGANPNGGEWMSAFVRAAGKK